MIHSYHKKTTWLTAAVFVFLLIAPAYSYQSDESNDINTTLETGEQLFTRGEYEKALPFLEKAATLIRDNNILSGLYLKISYAHFKLGNTPKSEEWLRYLFEMDPGIETDMSQYESGFSMIYKKIQAEYWFSIRNRTEAEQKQYQKVIEKYSRRPEKKRNKLIPTLLISGVVIAAILITVLTWENKKDNYQGTLIVKNSFPYGVTVSVGDFSLYCSSNHFVKIYLEAGTHTVKITGVDITGLGNSKIYTVIIEENQTTTINFLGWDVP
jgi:tetratricopeptide (TPR) repeat protein